MKLSAKIRTMKLSHKIRYGILLLIPFIVVLLIAQFVYNHFIKIAPAEYGQNGLIYNNMRYALAEIFEERMAHRTVKEAA